MQKGFMQYSVHSYQNFYICLHLVLHHFLTLPLILCFKFFQTELIMPKPQAYLYLSGLSYPLLSFQIYGMLLDLRFLVLYLPDL
jgi:hypothetical protein